MVLNAITVVPNGIMRVIGGMEGTNVKLGQDMSSGVKSGLMIGATRAISAVQAGQRTKALDPNGPGTKGAGLAAAANPAGAKNESPAPKSSR